jgi:alkylation response protein AidB-like acyl-CoA dehydrogenase
VQALNVEQELIISTVRKFVEKEVIPVASELDHRNEYPHALVRQMQEMGLFGLNIPEEFGGAAVDTTTFAMVFEEISRGWLGLAGVIGSNSVMCDVVVRFGTEDQKRRFLPAMASGEKRGGICLTESNAGTDLQNISTTATRDGALYRINGAKLWITNARHGNTFLLLAKTDPSAQPAHRGMSAFLFEKGAPGLNVSRDIDKLGYKGVETCELHFDNFPVPAENLVGGVEGHGFKQVMTGLEAERLNVAATRSGHRASRV